MTDLSKLVRISTYAKMIGKTPVWVQYLIKHGKLNTVLVDNTIFIVLP